jgi:hypothetical protein
VLNALSGETVPQRANDSVSQATYCRGKPRKNRLRGVVSVVGYKMLTKAGNGRKAL